MSLSPQEMLELYRKAQDTGHVNVIANDADCNSEVRSCESCPAGPACDQLAVNKDFQGFGRNFREQILPILEDRDYE